MSVTFGIERNSVFRMEGIPPPFQGGLVRWTPTLGVALG
jgi:hypothetical protein